MVDQEANDTAAEFVRAKIREQGARSGARRAAVAQEHHRLQAAVHRHRLLRDLQPAERDADRRRASRRSRRSRGSGVKVGGREYEVDAIVFATGFDAMTGALLKIDIRGRGGLALQREVERGAAHLSRAGDGGLSQPVHDHRPGQPLGADQHAPHHRAARRLDRRQPRRTCARATSARIEPSVAGRGGLGARTSATLAGRTLRYTCGSWYLGVNIPGKPRVFMPYIGGFPNYIQKCNEVAAGGYEGFVLS